MIKLIGLLFALLLVANTCVNAWTAPYKRLAGPPEEFANHILPDPTAGAQESKSALIPVTFQEASDGSNKQVWTGNLPVDSSIQFTLTVFSPIESELDIQIQPPGADSMLPLSALASLFGSSNENIIKGTFGIGDNTVPSTTYVFDKPATGVYKVIVSTKLPNTQKSRANAPDVYLLLENVSDYKAYAHINTYNLQTGQNIGLMARLYNEKMAMVDEKGSPAAIRFEEGAKPSVSMYVTMPNGASENIPMHDDGGHGDLLANDGIYGASITAQYTGQYKAQLIMEGYTPSGTPFLRTTQHILQVVDTDLTLTGSVSASESDSAVKFTFEATWNKPSSAASTKFKAYAEVWGTDSNGNQVPIAWISGMTDAEATSTSGVYGLSLYLEKDWIARAQANAPFQVKNAWVQEPNTNIPVSKLASAAVAVSGELSIDYTNVPQEITERMRMGPRPATLKAAQTNGKNVLVLVHGYCTRAMPWSLEDFTDYAAFEDYNANRNHDQFAQLIAQFASGFDSYGLIGHSQGGPAILHLFTFYWTGVDEADGKRILQSVGSPYLGNTLAGSLAHVGEIFGVGCGTNFDLTTDGAALWLPSIPKASRQQVYFYTTQYKPFSYCNAAAQAVLKWPNDGTAEYKYTQLPDANNMGHKEGWCHSVDMHFPPQCTDHTRNAEMNTLAYR
eukprot:GEZU01013198.1.p1 GENE.GEZU01013198.1~~GEZU01013198.1.p1  ORF type:complete len:674 (+),score=199.90 GEZU01013198.1:77-2098(+)